MNQNTNKICEEILDRHITDHEFKTYINLNFGENCKRLGFKALEAAGLLSYPKKDKSFRCFNEEEKIEIIQEAHDLLNDDPEANLGSISSEHGVHIETLRRWARKQNRPFLRRAKITTENQLKTIAEINMGASITDACGSRGFSPAGFMKAIKKSGYFYNKETQKICKK